MRSLRDTLIATACSAALVYAVAPAVGGQATSPEAFMKQAGAAFFVYAADFDSTLPLAGATENGKPMMGSSLIRVPASWGAKPQLDEVCWANALQPYLVNSGAWAVPDAPTVSRPGPNQPPSSAPLIGITYNGLLHRLTLSSVTNTAAPLIWTGLGKANYKGLAMSSPMLQCPDPSQDCIYKTRGPGGGLTRGVLMMAAGTMEVFNGKMAFLRNDGSASFVTPGQLVPGTDMTDSTVDPGAQYVDGKPVYYWQDGSYPILFKPFVE